MALVQLPAADEVGKYFANASCLGYSQFVKQCELYVVNIAESLSTVRCLLDTISLPDDDSDMPVTVGWIKYLI